MDAKNPEFKVFHISLNNNSTKLLSERVGASKKQARIVTSDKENLLWEKGEMGVHSPNSLLNAVFFTVVCTSV